jgi:transposase
MSGGKRDQLIVVLLSGLTIRRAAERVGVSERTARRWMKEPAFREAYEQARREAFDAALSVLQGASTRAVQALLRALGADRASDRIRAADLILTHAAAGHSTQDLAGKLAQLAELAELLKTAKGKSK